MRKAWFCYEATSTGVTPVIYYDNLPNQKNSLNPRIVQTHPLDSSWEQKDDELIAGFTELQKAFPFIGSESE